MKISRSFYLSLHCFCINMLCIIKCRQVSSGSFHQGIAQRITVPLPSGLHFVLADWTIKSAKGKDIFIQDEDALSHICLLHHDVVNLRPQYRKVYEISSLFPTKLCAQLIVDAEVFAAKGDGWTRQRHIGYPTTDIPLEDIYGPLSAVHGLIVGEIFPILAEKFGLVEGQLRLGEAFVAKYESSPGKQAGLGKHRDGTPWSFVMTLNQPDTEFVGGGTNFFQVDDDRPVGNLYRPREVGSVVLFSGRHLHEGVAVSSGVRYILTGFCSYAPPPPPARGSGRDSDSDDLHHFFMRDYCPDSDGRAAGAGIRTGDTLTAVHLPDYRPSDSDSDATHRTWAEHVFERDGAWFVSTERMGADTLRALLKLCAASSCGSVDLLIERSNGVDDNDDFHSESLSAYVQRHAGDIFSKGMHWSMDEAIGGII